MKVRVVAVMVMALSLAERMGMPDPMVFQVIPEKQYICVGGTATLAAQANDIDPWCHAEGMCDKITFSPWPPGDGWNVIDPYSCSGLCWCGGIVGKTYTEPGKYSYSITASDQSLCETENDPDITKTVEIWVCRTTVSVTRTELEAGCGELYNKTIATCELSDGCPEPEPGGEIEWRLTGPLRVSRYLDEHGYRIELTASLPATCEETGTITAVFRGCSSPPVTVTVRKLGEFSFGETGHESHCYTPENPITFIELGMDPPVGCTLMSPAYGCITVIHYQLCSTCPVMRSIWAHEELEDGAGCSCAPTNEWQDWPGPFTGCITTPTDTIGILQCDCSDLAFIGHYHCKRMQSIYIGEDCLLAQKCQDVTRDNTGIDCRGLTQSVVVTDGWYGCSCY